MLYHKGSTTTVLYGTTAALPQLLQLLPPAPLALTSSPDLTEVFEITKKIYVEVYIADG